MDLTGYGWTIFWVVAFGVAGAAIIWTRTQKRRESQAPRLYTEALRALVDGEDQMAFERLKAVVTEDSSNLDAYLKLGDLLRRRGRVDRAIRVHEELTLRLGLTKPQSIAVQKSLAQDFLAAGDLSAAENSLRKILDIDSAHRWAAEKLVRVYEKEGQFDEAFALRREESKRSGQTDESKLALYKTFAGVKIDANGQGHNARLLYKEALGHDGKCLPALLYIGDSYWKEGRQDDAVEWWSKLAETEPRAAHLVFERLRKAYFEMGRYGEISQVYERTLEADPSNTRALLGLAELALKKGELDNALAQYRHILDIDSENVAARAGIVNVLVQQKKLPDAATEIEAILESDSFRSSGYTCKRCGHHVDEPEWQCPQCKAVGSFALY
jgi:lipopolysaccharide biosynthesis regulator YciM